MVEFPTSNERVEMPWPSSTRPSHDAIDAQIQRDLAEPLFVPNPEAEDHAQQFNMLRMQDILLTRFSHDDAEQLQADIERLYQEIQQQLREGTVVVPFIPGANNDQTVVAYMKGLAESAMTPAIAEALHLGFEDRALTVAPFTQQEAVLLESNQLKDEEIDRLTRELKQARLAKASSDARSWEMLAMLAHTPEERQKAIDLLKSNSVRPEFFVEPAVLPDDVEDVHPEVEVTTNSGALRLMLSTPIGKGILKVFPALEHYTTETSPLQKVS